jgi:hypothetical protein
MQDNQAMIKTTRNAYKHKYELTFTSIGRLCSYYIIQESACL